MKEFSFQNIKITKITQHMKNQENIEKIGHFRTQIENYNKNQMGT